MGKPLFSIVTPSFNGAGYTRLAVASVADQGVPYEHIIQDAGSRDGSLEGLEHPNLHIYQETDSGMYDAINRGLQKSSGEICAHLNCDEQYLPGAFVRVAKIFETDPSLDLMVSGAIVINENRQVVLHRRGILGDVGMIANCFLPSFTCATFFRRRIFEDGAHYFDSSYKSVGDAEWMIRFLASGRKAVVLPGYTSLFVHHKTNIGLGEQTEAEALVLKKRYGSWSSGRRIFEAVKFQCQKKVGDRWDKCPENIDIFLAGAPEERVGLKLESAGRNPYAAVYWLKRIFGLRDSVASK